MTDLEKTSLIECLLLVMLVNINCSKVTNILSYRRILPPKVSLIPVVLFQLYLMYFGNVTALVLKYRFSLPPYLKTLER